MEHGDADQLHEECGVMGVWGHPEAAHLVYLGLYALQHRGQEACGIVTFEAPRHDAFKSAADHRRVYAHKAFGLVSDTVNREVITGLRGDIGIGHVRYATSGGQLLQNIQPFVFQTPHFGAAAIAHNGNLTNAALIRRELEEAGSIFASTSDTEVFMHLFARARSADVVARLREVMRIVHGAYALVLSIGERMFALRDPFGFRPLVLGRMGAALVAASETCALDLLGATFIREVAPDEIVELTGAGLISHKGTDYGRKASFCAFEQIYFARPDSVFFDENVYTVRKRMGAILAREAPAAADIVIAVPDSGVPMALGYAAVTGLPLELGIVRNHYIGRTFIEPTQAIRDFGVKLKLNVVAGALEGRRVVVVDDSLVRGTTSTKIVRMLRNGGAKSVHFRVGSPPITHSCFYGVDTPGRENLLAAQKNVAEICEYLGADSLAFLTLDGLREALGNGSREAVGGRYCTACFTGDYQEAIYSAIAPQPTDKGSPGYQATL